MGRASGTAGQTPDQSGPSLPVSDIINYYTGKNLAGIVYGQATLSGGLATIKLTGLMAMFNNTNYAVVVTPIYASDGAQTAEGFTINRVSATEFHIVSSSGSSSSTVGFIAFGE
jgi:hypothetical protein